MWPQLYSNASNKDGCHVDELLLCSSNGGNILDSEGCPLFIVWGNCMDCHGTIRERCSVEAAGTLSHTVMHVGKLR